MGTEIYFLFPLEYISWIYSPVCLLPQVASGRKEWQRQYVAEVERLGYFTDSLPNKVAVIPPAPGLALVIPCLPSCLFLAHFSCSLLLRFRTVLLSTWATGAAAVP